nr:cobaltochelatase subunit CobN [Blautia luti]
MITDGLHKISQEEISGLLHGLNGRYVPVGTAGDVVKNPDILPSGRNLVQFDPRLVSTRTAWERGQKAGRNHT